MIEEENKKLIEKGEKKKSIEIAKKMLKENVDISFIARVTGLKEEKIKKMKQRFIEKQ